MRIANDRVYNFTIYARHRVAVRPLYVTTMIPPAPSMYGTEIDLCP